MTGSPHPAFARTLPARLLAVMLLAAGSVLGAQQLSIGLVPDGITLTAGIVAAGASTFLPTNAMPATLDAGGINAFDSRAYFGYSRGFDVASDILQYATTAFPLLMAFSMNNEEAAAAGVIYSEVLSTAYFSRSVVKFFFPRARPWAYFVLDDGPTPNPEEGNESFPSGHATLAFASAAFGITTFAVCFPDSPWLVPFTVAEIALASATAAFRVRAGMHFMSDVLVGAALGTAIGVALPLLHVTGGASGDGRFVPFRATMPLISVSF
jgi:membrane-associated phospholipid phosphatase